MNGDANPSYAIMNGVSAGAAAPSAKAMYEQRKQYGKSSVNTGEISQYNVEHLTTYTIDRKDGLNTVEDGVRKLKLLDARGKVWTQEALMQVDEKAVKLFDQTTQEELEHFPMSSVQYVQVATDSDPYSIVALVVKESDQKMPDMHLFHSPTVPADVIGADIESALADCRDKKGKKTRPETLRRTRERVQASVIPPPPSNPPPAPPIKDGNVRDMVETWGNLAQSSEFQTGQDYNVSPEVLTLKISRDVQILNHALDDVEFFVSRLQKSAQAIQDLQQRKSKKSKGRKKGGDGMLTLRSKLPPHDRFIEIFRKFKFCLNLVAKLRAHIQNPNAIEIVHFIFTPMKMCIQACGGLDIPRSVESPLLTKDAIDLLHNCLTTAEAEIWRSLGDCWNRSRAEFPEELFFAPYIPRFRNGWEPPPILGDNNVDEDKAREFAAMVQNQANRVNQAETRRASDTSQAFKQHVEMHVQRNQNFNGYNASAAKAMCRSLYDFTGRNKNELNVRRDEMLEVLDDSKAWWRVQNTQGQSGYVPSNHMVLISHTRSPSSNSSDFGMPASPPPTVPSPPPAPAPPPTPTASKITPVPVAPIRREPASNHMNGNNNSASNQPIYAQMRKPSSGNAKMDLLAGELKERVNLATSQQRNFSIPKKRANAGMLKVTTDSSKADVKRWLESLGFSQLTVDSLGVLTGAQLFTLTKEELKMVCEEDGARVYSQITVQKSFMKDGQNGEDELRRALNKRKVKSET